MKFLGSKNFTPYNGILIIVLLLNFQFTVGKTWSTSELENTISENFEVI